MTQSARAPLPRVLYVDDDARALELLREQAGRQFDVSTASNGIEGLELLTRQGPFAVVVSDYQMIGMSGILFLSKVKELAPESTRLLLTAHPDLTAAIGAVNDGHCFRFMTKPCPRTIMVRNLTAAVDQYRLVISQRVLLEQTLRASVKALTDVLALATPAAFGRATRARDRISSLLDYFPAIGDRWEVEVAAMLSQIGCVALPPETALKVYQGQSLSPDENAMADRLAPLAEQLVADIPRLEGVRAILHYREKHFDGSGSPQGSVRGAKIPWGARALKIALDFDVLEAQGSDTRVALDTMRGRSRWYDPAILEAFAEIRIQERAGLIQELALREVIAGMTFADDVRTRTGAMLIARGTQVTPSLSERVRNLAPDFVQERVKVIRSTSTG